FSAPAAVTAWGTWHDVWVASTRPLTDRLLEAARIAPGMRVLDVASGTGDPALTIADLVAPRRRVTASDPSTGLLATPRARAARRPRQPDGPAGRRRGTAVPRRRVRPGHLPAGRDVLPRPGRRAGGDAARPRAARAGRPPRLGRPRPRLIRRRVL